MMTMFALALAIPGQDDSMIGRYPGWRLYRNDDHCALLHLDIDTALAAGPTFRMGYYPDDDTTRIAFVQSAQNGVVVGDSYEFTVRLTGGDGTVRDLGKQKLNGIKLAQYGWGYRLVMKGRSIIDDIGRSARIELLEGATMIESRTLEKLTRPVADLQACVAAIAK